MLAPLTEAASKLTRQLGLGDVDTLESLPTNGNNRVFRAVAAGRPLLIKQYFHDDEADRTRLDAEIRFARYAWSTGVRCIPEPLIADYESGVAIFAFIEGRGVAADEIDRALIGSATDFLAQLNRARDNDVARALPIAAEACFDVAGHVALVEQRVARLSTIEAHDEIDRAAAEFVAGELVPHWRDIAGSLGATATPALPQAERCLSPSDFGFHNVVLADGDRTKPYFFDFEYAGWDDPAKLICDFYCQLSRPVPTTTMPWFIRRVIDGLAIDPRVEDRARNLLPLYRVKWCGIAMNVFLPAGRQRRIFVSGDSDLTDLKRERLNAARRLIHGVR